MKSKLTRSLTLCAFVFLLPFVIQCAAIKDALKDTMLIPGLSADSANSGSAVRTPNSATPAGVPIVPGIMPGGGCPAGMSQCALPGRTWFCASFATDPYNCGACCNECGPDEVCCRGQCTPRDQCDIPALPIPSEITGGCPPGYERCQHPSGCKFCARTNWDRYNCGSCGVVCGRGKVCRRGQCVTPTTDENCGFGCNRCGEGQRCCPQPNIFSGWQCVDLGTDRNCMDCDDACLLSETCCPGVGCRDLRNDPNNCGRCGNYCSPPKVCYSGACICPKGLHPCGNTCCSPGDPCCESSFGASCCTGDEICCPNIGCRVLGTQQNCAACGHACAANERCCDPRDKINGCKRIDSITRCGQCGHSCGPDEHCCYKGDQVVSMGPHGYRETGEIWDCTSLNTNTDCSTCNDSCDPLGESCCNNVCVDTRTDPENCGDCNVPCHPPRICQDGQCVCPSNREECGSICCQPGESCCDNVCMDTRSDPDNCGDCNRSCPEQAMCHHDGRNCYWYRLECSNGECVCPTDDPQIEYYLCHDWCIPRGYVCCEGGPRGKYACPAGTVCCNGNCCLP